MSEDYLAYKKSKLEEQNKEKEKLVSKRKIAAIFVITFFVCFVFVINVITRYGAKIDIEYGRAIQPSDGLPVMDGPFVRGSNQINNFIEDRKAQIDSRLKVLQLEEVAPSEARILGASKNKDKVVDVESYKKLVGEQKTKKQESEIAEPKKEEAPKPQAPPKVVVSKVLIGRYQGFDEARAAQETLKENSDTITFVRKMGEIYSLQVGSYVDENIAKSTANKYQEAGYSVWILQD